MATYYETGISDNGPLRYRVQLRQRERFVVDQRHVWYPPTPHVSEPTAEDWIPSAGHRIPPHFRKVADPDRGARRRLNPNRLPPGSNRAGGLAVLQPGTRHPTPRHRGKAMQEAQDSAQATAWGEGYNDGAEGRPQSWPDAETLPDYEAGHAAGREDADAALLGPWRTTAKTSPGSVPEPPPRERPLVDLEAETVGSRSRPRTRFKIVVGGEIVGHVEAETSAAVRGIMLRGEPFGRYGSLHRDYCIEVLLVKRSERRRLGETIRRIMGLPKE